VRGQAPIAVVPSDVKVACVGGGGGGGGGLDVLALGPSDSSSASSFDDPCDLAEDVHAEEEEEEDAAILFSASRPRGVPSADSKKGPSLSDDLTKRKRRRARIPLPAIPFPAFRIMRNDVAQRRVSLFL